MFLALDPGGRIWGGPTFGQTLFWLDPQTKKYENTGKISNHGGEVYDTAFIGDNAYSVAYVGGEVIRYDTTKPFDQFHGKNPRAIATVAPDYIRPQAGITVGPDGLLYSGWIAKYGTYGGAVAITDPDSGKTTTIENPLAVQGVSGVAVDAERIYVGTTLAANGLRNKPDEFPKFGVLDIHSHKVLFSHTFDKAGSVHHVDYDAPTGRVAMVVNGVEVSRIEVYDAKSSMLLTGLPTAPAVTSASASTPGDGHTYYGSDNRVVAVDLATGRTETVAELPAKVEHIVAGRDGAVYVSCGVDVYRAREAGTAE
jgi:hypothetical protein